MKKIFLKVLIVFIMFMLIGCNSQNDDNSSTTKLVESDLPIINITDNIIIITLKKESSSKLGNYTTKKFEKYGCVNLINLSDATMKMTKNGTENSINPFERVFVLTLDKHSVDNVLDVYDALKKRSDIEDVLLEYDKTIESEETVNYNYYFSDNSISIVLNKESSLRFDDYTKETFSEYGCIDLVDNNPDEVKQYKKFPNNIPSRYKRSITLILDKHSSSNIFYVCNAINKRSDVERVSPEYHEQIKSFTYYAKNYKIWVYLYKESSLKFNHYTIDTFKKYGCIKLDDVNRYYVEEIKKGISQPDDDYRRILSLTTNTKSLEEAIKVRDALFERDDVESIEIIPNATWQI